MLNEGKVNYYGDIGSAISHYAQQAITLPKRNLAERRDRSGSRWLQFIDVVFCDAYGNEQEQILSGQDIFIRFYYVSNKVMSDAVVNIAFNVRTSQGYLLTNLNSVDVDQSNMSIQTEGYFQCFWPTFNLRSDFYDCALFCAVNGEIVDWLQSAFTIQVEDGDYYNTGKLSTRDAGDILISYAWSSHSNK